MGIEAYGDVAEGVLTEKAGHVQHFVGKAPFPELLFDAQAAYAGLGIDKPGRDYPEAGGYFPVVLGKYVKTAGIKAVRVLVCHLLDDKDLAPQG